MKNILVAHSPDSDDIFMYYAIKLGWVDTKNYNFSNISDDIETLNKAAIENKYDVCAISFALYPHIYNEQTLLRTAVSFGDGYGPKLIKRKGSVLKSNFKVALSGEYTTNAMIFKSRYKDAKIVYKNFMDIEKAVISGEVDAGVLIHESILMIDDALEVEAEIFDIWNDYAKGLPLPLGGMSMRRSIHITDAISIEEILIDAVKVANDRKEELIDTLQKSGDLKYDKKLLEKYLQMYANKDSVELGDLQIEAIEKLFKFGYDNGFYSKIIDIEKAFIPREYKELRNS